MDKNYQNVDQDEVKRVAVLLINHLKENGIDEAIGCCAMKLCVQVMESMGLETHVFHMDQKQTEGH